MKILILGASGQLGTELLYLLQNPDLSIGTLPDVYSSCQVICKDIDTLDITKLNNLQEFCEFTSPDIIINCAAIATADYCEENPKQAFAVNAIGARNAAIVAEKISAKLLYMSSDYVFDGGGVSHIRNITGATQ